MAVFSILLLWVFQKLYAQDTLLTKISNDDMSIKAKLDSIRDRLKKDTVSSELFFFNINVSPGIYRVYLRSNYLGVLHHC